MGDELQTSLRPGLTSSEPYVVILGWGCPVEVIPPLHLPGPTTLCAVGDPFTFTKRFAAWRTKSGPLRYHLVGWSLGAHLALDIARHHPADVASLTLCSLRSSFPAHEITDQINSLYRDPAAHLQAFFRRVFAGQADAWRAFNEHQLPHLLQISNSAELVEGLRYLQQCRLIEDDLIATQARLIQGRRDLIAPLAELEAVLSPANAARLTQVSGAGHALFWSSEWAELWRN